MSSVKPFIEFNITDKCTNRCAYCTHRLLLEAQGGLAKEASDATLSGFLQLVKKLGTEFDVQFIGGEAFCHPKFIETAEQVAKNGNNVIVYSNMSFPIASWKKLINVTGDRLKLIHGALHTAQIKNLDATLEKVIQLATLIDPATKLQMASVVTEENFETLKYIKNRLSSANIDFIFARMVKINQNGGELSKYPHEIEDYLRQNEHEYNVNMQKTSKFDTKWLLCHCGSKILHIRVDGTITRCWAMQTRHWVFGDVAIPESITLLKAPMPCYAQRCATQHPTSRNAQFYSLLTPIYRFAENILLKIRTNKHNASKS